MPKILLVPFFSGHGVVSDAQKHGQRLQNIHLKNTKVFYSNEFT